MKAEIESTTCDAPGCDRERDHDGPHGHPVRGFILAPWSDSARTSHDDGDPIPCNSCGQPLTLHPERCRAECDCGQMITFDDRGYSQTILPRLYPSKMTDPKMLREFTQHRLEEWTFFDELQVRFGLIDRAEFGRRRAIGVEKIECFIETDIIPLERRPWWQFWRSQKIGKAS